MTTIPMVSDVSRKGAYYDRWFMVAVMSLLAIGFLVVCSSSIEYSNKLYGSSFSIMIRHGIYIFIGFLAALVIRQIPIAVWQKNDWILLLLGLALLVAVLIPGIGKLVNGSWRWIRLGPIGIQSSELMKFFLVIYISGYLIRRAEEVKSQWSGFLKPIVVLAIVIVLLLLEPDFGAVVVTLSAVLGMMFLGGVRASQFFVLVVVCSAAVGLLAIEQPYRVQRLLAFTDPWSSENVFGSGYQLTQALIAFGRGEWFGVGIGNSILKLFYLPEAHTDFVFAILGEEYGLFGVMVVLALFTILIARIFAAGRLAEQKQQTFSAYVCYGIAIILAVQSLINVGVNIGLLPTKGLTLPLLSYGGSSIVVTLGMLAFVARAYSEALSVSKEDEQ
ncbi:putative lipid II flippase FtsW [Gynuella sunshinyii]|uniref:Probable peptidoglycan glycosyltransferase FtsW n=1 Tax=Gynuella sunshinyii YC6258 TaxID=1445510 RepID=A0A0C5V4L3_9GAMM|nr:putative lipid II flippase FtsW [Gynuella sunshinyii]AJQ94430.1 bacterial cell division membrane protein [Gynuella sunshinyii YC6258]